MTRLSGTVGEGRSNAIYRILFAFILSAGGIAVLVALFTIGVIAAFVFHVLDVLKLLITNERFGQGMLSKWSRALFWWPIRMVAWLLFGNHSFPWLPSSSPVKVSM